VVLLLRALCVRRLPPTLSGVFSVFSVLSVLNPRVRFAPCGGIFPARNFGPLFFGTVILRETMSFTPAAQNIPFP